MEPQSVIAIEKERQALRLLAAGRLSQRRIAQVVGIARGTVATLKRIGHERPRGQTNMLLVPRPPGPIEQCPGCGRLIEMPCLACQAEGHREMRPARKSPAAPAQEADLRPDLDEDLSISGLLARRQSGESQRSLKRWLEERAAHSGQGVAPAQAAG